MSLSSRALTTAMACRPNPTRLLYRD